MSQINANNYKQLYNYGRVIPQFKQDNKKEDFGAFSISAAVRPSFNTMSCTGCQMPPQPHLSGVS